MKRKTFLIALTLVLAVMVMIPAGSAFAQTVIYTGNLDIIVEDGEVREGSVEVTGGELVVHAGGMIDGDVTILGGNATIDGDIDGDIAVFGGNVTLSGAVDGDLINFGGNLEITEGGTIDGDCMVVGGNVTDNSNQTNCASFAEDRFPFENGLGSFFDSPSGASVPPVPGPDGNGIPRLEPPPTRSGIASFLVGIGGALGRSLIAAFVAFLIAALMPEQLKRTSKVVRNKPVASGLVGVLSMVTAPALLTLLLILSAVLILACGLGLLGFPVAIVLVIAMVAAGVFGWVAMGNLLGRRLARWMKMKTPSLAFTAAFGTFVLSLALGLLALPRALPLEDILNFVVLALGLGATVLTMFGTKPYPREPEPVSTDKVEIVLRNTPTTE